MYNMFYAKDYFIEKCIYSNTPELFVQEFMSDVTLQLQEPAAIFTVLFSTVPGKALWYICSQPNTP